MKRILEYLSLSYNAHQGGSETILKAILAGPAALITQLLSTSGLAAGVDANYKIVTGPERGANIQIGQDLAKWVAPTAGIDLEVIPSKGSAEKVQSMRFDLGVNLALQSDVYQAYVDMANSGNEEAGQLIRPRRLIMPPYEERIYFVVRSDSPIKTSMVGPGAPAAPVQVI